MKHAVQGDGIEMEEQDVIFPLIHTTLWDATHKNWDSSFSFHKLKSELNDMKNLKNHTQQYSPTQLLWPNIEMHESTEVSIKIKLKFICITPFIKHCFKAASQNMNISMLRIEINN